MNILNPLVDIDRLNDLVSTKPALATELGILRADPLDDLIRIPHKSFDLKRVQIGQAAIFANTGHLRLEMWTSAHMDFNVKEWAETIQLDDHGQGEANGVEVSVHGGVVVLTTGADRLRLPAFADKLSNGAPLSPTISGQSRFSVLPKRQSWTTGKMVWL